MSEDFEFGSWNAEGGIQYPIAEDRGQKTEDPSSLFKLRRGGQRKEKGGQNINSKFQAPNNLPCSIIPQNGVPLFDMKITHSVYF
jgi:hypothetical protein